MKQHLLAFLLSFACYFGLSAQAQVNFFSTDVSVNEADREVQVTLTTSQAGGKGTIQVSGATATNGTDFEFPPTYLFEFIDANPISFFVPIKLDDIAEGEETFTLTITPDPGTTVGLNDEMIVRIQDPNVPVTAFAETAVSLEEQSVSRTLTINRKNLAASTSTIEVVDLLTGNAISGTDYIFRDTTITFAPGQTEATVPYQIIEDLNQEVNHNFVLQINPITNADTADGKGTFVFTILDDDKPSLYFPEPVMRIIEGDTQFVQINLDAPAFFTVSGDLVVVPSKTTTSNDFDNGGATAIPYATQSFSFPIGDTVITVPIYTFNDVLIEGQENLVLKMENLSNADETTADQEALINIADNDKVLLEYNSPIGNHLEDEGTIYGNINLHPETSPLLAPGQTAIVKKELNFSLQKIGGTAQESLVGDYYIFPKTFTIPNNFVVEQGGISTVQYQFSFLDDDLTECDETYHVGIKLPTPAEFFPIDTVPFNGNIAGTIVDNDSSKVSFGADTLTFLESDGAQTLNLAVENPNVHEDIDVEVSLIPGGTASQSVDFQFTYPQYYSFAKNDRTAQAFDLFILEDALIENTETFLVQIKVTSPAFTCDRIVQLDTTVFQIIDNDSTEITISNDTYDVSETPNSNGMGGFDPNIYYLEFKLTKQFQNPVDVQLDFNNVTATYGFDPIAINPDHGDAYMEDATNTPIGAVALPIMVTIPPYTTNYATEIYITDDIIQEGDHQFDVILSKPAGAIDNWSPGAQDSIRVNIIDDDPIVRFQSDSTNAPEAIGDFALNIEVNGNTKDDLVFVEILINNPDIGTATDSLDFIARDTVAQDTILLVIPSGSGNVYPTLVEIIDDEFVEGNETIYFTITNAGIGSTELAVYMADRANFVSSTPNLVDTIADSNITVIIDNDISLVFFDTAYGDTLDILESTVQTQITLMSNDPNLGGCGGSVRYIEGTATQGTDMIVIPQMPFLVTNGNSSIPDPVIMVNDQQPEVPEFFGLYIHPADIGTACPVGERDTLWIRILDDDRGDTLHFQTSIGTVVETEDKLAFNLINDSNTVIECAVRVTIDQAKSSATAMEDILFSSSVFDFSDQADTIVRVEIDLIDDLKLEGDELLVFYLEDIGVAGCPTDPTDSLYFTIVDNEVGYGLVPIVTIKPTDDITGIADSLDVQVDVTGIVHGLDYSGNATNLNFYIQDHTAGVNVRTAAGTFNYTPKEGDSLIVGGTVKQIDGLIYLEIDRLDKVQSGTTLFPAIDLNGLSEEFESEFVRLYCQEVASVEQWDAKGEFYDVQVAGDGTMNTVRIYQSSTMYNAEPLPGKISVSGIVSQTDRNEPYKSGYVLLARYKTDYKSTLRAEFDFTVSGPQVQFINNSYLASEASWIFGDNTAPSEENSPKYTYDAVGTYNVTLTVTNPRGCVDEVTEIVTIETLTGINDLSGNFVSVSPNPSSGIFTVQSSSNIQSVTVSDVSGKRLPVAISKKSNGSWTINLNDYSAGVYTAQFVTASGAIGNARLIKE